jgi:hypothetical protein
LLAVFGRFPPLTVPGALILVPPVLCFSLWTESFRGVKEGHIRFKPVQITAATRRPGACSPVMIPFALAAVALLLLPRIFPPGGGSPGGPPPAWTGRKIPPGLTGERYREHAAFQQVFSYTSLGAGEEPYLRYSLAGDGLIDGKGSGEAAVLEPEAIPPFPLAPLIDFLGNYSYTDPDPVAPQGEEFRCPLIVLGLCVVLIVRDRRGLGMRGKLSMYMDKRIAA